MGYLPPGVLPAFLREGSEVDAQDAKGQWHKAVVVRLNRAGTEVFIHFVYMASRFDCWIDVASPRLAEAGSKIYTQGSLPVAGQLVDFLLQEATGLWVPATVTSVGPGGPDGAVVATVLPRRGLPGSAEAVPWNSPRLAPYKSVLGQPIPVRLRHDMQWDQEEEERGGEGRRGAGGSLFRPGGDESGAGGPRGPGVNRRALAAEAAGRLPSFSAAPGGDPAAKAAKRAARAAAKNRAVATAVAAVRERLAAAAAARGANASSNNQWEHGVDHDAESKLGDAELVSGGFGGGAQLQGDGDDGRPRTPPHPLLARPPGAGGAHGAGVAAARQQQPSLASFTRDEVHAFAREAGVNPHLAFYLVALAAQGLSVVPMGGDGNCLFRTISHQVYGTEAHHGVVRAAAAAYIAANEWFMPFVVAEADNFAHYTAQIARDGVWGGDPEIQAVCEIYGRPAQLWGFDGAAGARRLRVLNSEGSAAAAVAVHPAAAAGGGAGGAVPGATSGRAGTAAAICLSFGGGGHYDSVVGPAWEPHLLRSQPGVVEAAAVRAAQARQAARAAAPAPTAAAVAAAAAAGGGGAGAAAAGEGDELARALALSRAEFDAQDEEAELAAAAASFDDDWATADAAPVPAAAATAPAAAVAAAPAAAASVGGSASGTGAGGMTLEDQILASVMEQSRGGAAPVSGATASGPAPVAVSDADAAAVLAASAAEAAAREAAELSAALAASLGAGAAAVGGGGGGSGAGMVDDDASGGALIGALDEDPELAAALAASLGYGGPVTAPALASALPPAAVAPSLATSSDALYEAALGMTEDEQLALLLSGSAGTGGLHRPAAAAPAPAPRPMQDDEDEEAFLAAAIEMSLAGRR